jgi:hypothetical protein
MGRKSRDAYAASSPGRGTAVSGERAGCVGRLSGPADPSRQLSRARARYTASDLAGEGVGTVNAASISSIVRPRVSKPMNSTATIPRIYQAAK